MAASGFTPIQLYYSTVSGHAPVAGGLLDGELAINTAEGKLYYKNSSGVVTLLAGISGYSGISGFSGFSGISGYSGSGISGYSGSGVSGYSGFSGISGYSGANGTSGFSGISGYSGLGISGYSGFSGATGAGGSGTSGTSGYSGFSGISGYSGSNGSAGTSGFSGFSGATGANGTNGTSGYSGFSGTAGASGYSGATGPTAYPSTGFAISTGSAWGTSLPDPLPVNHGGTGISAVTAGYVPFGNSSTALSTSSLFNWSTANVRLGVGIAAPVATLHVRGGNSNNAIVDNDGSQYTSFSWYNNGTEKAQGYFDATNILFVLGTDVAAPFIFKANGTEGMRLSSGGGVSIGTSTGAGAGNLLVNGAVTSAIGYKFGSNSNFLYQSSSTEVTLLVNSTSATYVGFKSLSGVPLVNGPGGALALGTAGTESVRIDSSGNMLVGLTTALTNPEPSTAHNIVCTDDVATGCFLIGTNSSFIGRQSSDGSTLINSGQGSLIFSYGGYPSQVETMRIASNGIVTGTAGNLMLVSGTAQASTSGTSIDFTGIPSWAKRVTVMFAGVSTNGNSPVQIQVGAGSIATTGYVSRASSIGVSSGTISSTTGFVLTENIFDSDLVSGAIQLFVQSSTSIVCTGGLNKTATNFLCVNSGLYTISGALDRIRVTTVNGTDAFDAGSINILYE